MSAVSRVLVAATATALLAGGFSATSPSPTSAAERRADRAAVRTTTWTAKIEVKNGSAFYSRVPGVRPGRYLAGLSGAFQGSSSGVNCGLVTSDERTLLAAASAPLEKAVSLIDASRTIRVAKSDRLAVVCFYAGEVEAVSTVPGYPLQLSLTTIDKLSSKALQPVTAPTRLPAPLR